MGQELLSVRPDSSTSGTLPSSPRSPSESSPGPMYDDVTTSNRARPMYSVVDISKKKNRKNGSTPTAAVRHFHFLNGVMFILFIT